MASTYTLQQSITFAQSFKGNRFMTGNTGSEPAITIGNIVKQTILGAPFEWRWNRKSYSWTLADPATVWQATHVYALGSFLIDSNGNLQRVTAIGSAPHQSGSSQPTWSTDVTTPGTTTDGNLTWTANSANTYVQTVSDLGWIENASVKDIKESVPTGSTRKWYELENKNSLAVETTVGRPKFISAQSDDNAGSIGFSFSPQPNAAYPALIQIQKKATLFTALTGAGGTWDPIPDEFGFVYNQGFLALTFMYADDPRFAAANAKFVASLLGVSTGLTDTEKNIFLNNWNDITQGQMMKMQQGINAKGQ